MDFGHLKIDPDEGFTYDLWDGLLDQLNQLSLTIPDNTDGEIINEVSIGTKPGDGSEMNYPWEFETIGVSGKTRNLRLQSPNSVFIHTNIDGNEATNKTKVPLAIMKDGKIGMGTIKPLQELHIFRPTSDNVDLRLENKSGKPMDVFAGTKGCGLWSHGTKAMQFATNNKERLKIDKDGKHTITGKGGSNIDLTINGRLQSNNNDGGLWIAGNRFFGGHSTDKMGLWNGSAWRLTVQKNGNVGIGTDKPAHKLHINGEVMVEKWVRTKGKHGLHFEDFGGGFYMTDSSWIRTYGNKHFYHNTGMMRTDGELMVGDRGNRFIVNSRGNMGLGISKPATKMHVIGNRIRLQNPSKSSQFIDIRADGAVLDIESSMSMYLNNNGNKVIIKNLKKSSSRALKDAIGTLPLSTASQILAKLNPVSYKYKSNPNDRVQYGFIAEDHPEEIAEKDKASIDPVDLIAILCKVVQAHELRLEKLIG